MDEFIEELLMESMGAHIDENGDIICNKCGKKNEVCECYLKEEGNAKR